MCEALVKIPNLFSRKFVQCKPSCFVCIEMRKLTVTWLQLLSECTPPPPPPQKKCEEKCFVKKRRVLPIRYILFIYFSDMYDSYGDCIDVSYKHFCQQGHIKHNNYYNNSLFFRFLSDILKVSYDHTTVHKVSQNCGHTVSWITDK